MLPKVMVGLDKRAAADVVPTAGTRVSNRNYANGGFRANERPLK
jgi:hypothetical protein